MDLITFKNTQGPIKARYAGEAKEALLTLKATGTADDSAVVCKVETGLGLAVAGIHPKCGGSGLELCSGDMLLEALIACAGVSMRAAAAVLDIPVGSIKVSATTREGNPAKILLEAANGADMLVVGSRGHGGFTEALLGSVSQHCVHHAPCPVVIIRGAKAG